MLNKFTMATSLVFAWFALTLPASAQGAQFDVSGLYSAGAGTQGNTTYPTGQGPSTIPAVVSNQTSNQRIGTLNLTTTAGLAPIFGMSGGGYGGYGGYVGYGGAGTGGNLSSLEYSLPNSTFAQVHPRRTEVLTGDSALYNQINSLYGSLGDRYPQLTSQALGIQNQEEGDAAQNGGFITLAQQGQLNQEEGALSQQVQYDNANSVALKAANGDF